MPDIWITDAYSNPGPDKPYRCQRERRIGSYTNVDETIAAADGSFLETVSPVFSGYGPANGFSFALSNLPAEATSVNTVQFRVYAKVSGSVPGQMAGSWSVVLDVSGTNAPSTVANWTDFDSTSLDIKGQLSPASSSATIANINGWSVRCYQEDTEWGTPTGTIKLVIDAIEIIVDYNVAPPEQPSSPPAGGAYSVIPTTDTAIYGLCIARVRDFAVLGGMNTDRYSIRWSDINNPSSWSTPNTDAARAVQAGSQTFPTRFGFVTAISSNDFYGYVFQEKAITKMSYVGGDIVFNFDIFEEDRGCIRQGRMVQVDDKVFFQSNRGYHMLENDQILDIGYGIVDDSFN
ncbi:MAG: hypothetical protein HC808_10090 [Candidatus Competibacteraceae bacterium]|nr:hypothetical protein [Candidatus Competibacteraceae bacterium]